MHSWKATKTVTLPDRGEGETVLDVNWKCENCGAVRKMRPAHRVDYYISGEFSAKAGACEPKGK